VLIYAIRIEYGDVWARPRAGGRRNQYSELFQEIRDTI
jgi:hypothetical protein